MALPRPLFMLVLVSALYLFSAANLFEARRFEADARVTAHAWRASWFGPERHRRSLTMNGVAIGDNVHELRRRVCGSDHHVSFYRKTLDLHLERCDIVDDDTDTSLTVFTQGDRVYLVEAGHHCTIELAGRELFRQGLPRIDFLRFVSAASDEGTMTSLQYGPHLTLNVSTTNGIVELMTMYGR